MHRIGYPILVAAIIGLAGCGTSTTDRTITGAGLGAAAGAGGTAIAGGDPGTGALVGAAVGAVAGAATDSDDINLGKPVWRR